MKSILYILLYLRNNNDIFIIYYNIYISLNFNILEHKNKLLVLIKIKILFIILKIFLFMIRLVIFCRVKYIEGYY